MAKNDLATTLLEAFEVYQREYLCKSEEEIKREKGRLLHCHEYVVNNSNK